MSRAKAARHLLSRMQSDPRLANLIGPGTESFELLIEEAATAQNIDIDVMRSMYQPTVNGAAQRTDLVPGVMRCVKCEFQLVRVTLAVNLGKVIAGDSNTEPCPNGCGPLWPVTWKQYARQMQDVAEQLTERAIAAEQDAERYRCLRTQTWNEGSLCVVTMPKESVKLGFDCPSRQRLDEAIDEVMGKGAQP